MGRSIDLEKIVKILLIDQCIPGMIVQPVKGR
jgi:hypothetical protein